LTGTRPSSDDSNETFDWSDNASTEPIPPGKSAEPSKEISPWTGPSSARDRDSFELLAGDFAERCRRGEAPSISDYEERYPEHADAIRKFLPQIAIMEEMKGGSLSGEEGKTSSSVPERLGEYRIVREIGHGGMGIVYEAVQESLGRHVALKVIHRFLLDARRLERFRREAEAIAQLHHTNIVPIFAVGEQDGLPYYVMQLIRGKGLDAILTDWRGGGQPVGEQQCQLAARTCKQAAEAMHHAHQQGILHRDIKPANILVDEQGGVWITDFGLAKLAGQDDLTRSGDIVGTLRYLAPEALIGKTGAQSDVYSLGLTLYELLTLRSPFGDLSPSELLRHVREEQPTRPRKHAPSIPRDLETIVLKAIAKEPGHRYETAGALADDLQCFLEDRPIRARRVFAIERAWRWSRRNKATAALSAAAIILLILSAIIGWVGYASTTRALRQAQANESLSLDIFDRLFDRLGARANFLPPPVGRSARRRLPPPARRTEDFSGLAGLPKRPPPDRAKMPPPIPPRPGGPAGGPGPGEDPGLLQEVLAFYDRFAQQNAANPRLQLEAAGAYRRVGAIHENMGHREESERAYARAITMLENLVAQHPSVAAYRARLVDTYIMANPWTADPADLSAMEGRLRQAEVHTERIAAGSPPGADLMMSMIHVQAKLGTVLRRIGRLDEAEACYRRAIDLAGALVDRDSKDLRARLDRADTREAWALLEDQRDRKEQALTLLGASASELQSLAIRGPMPSVADRFEDLAEDYQGLGYVDQANEMSLWADRLRTRSRPPF
jgi:serine/threonine protein kinase